MILMEDAIRHLDLAQSVQSYQLAVDQAKVRLNLAVYPGAWLMPARMVKSMIGYNNNLKQAVAGMKLGLNNDVNPGTKKAGLQLMEGGPSKINPPSSHPSNPIHKAAMAVQSPSLIYKAATAAQSPKPASKITLPSDENDETLSEKATA